MPLRTGAIASAAPEGLRERRKRTTRAELLQAGRKLFSEKGLYLSRVEDLTSGAGIAKGTLYQYYRSKEELIHAVVEAGFADLHRCVDARASGARDADDLIMRIVAAHIDFLMMNADLMRIFHQVRGLLKFEGKEGEPLRKLLRAHLERLADRMGAVGPRGSGHPALRRELAELLFGAVSGAISVPASSRPGSPPVPSPRALTLGLVSMMATYAHARSGARGAGPLGRRKSSRRISKR